MSYSQLSIMLRTDSLYRAVEESAIKAEKAGSWLTAAKLRLYMGRRADRLFQSRKDGAK